MTDDLLAALERELVKRGYSASSGPNLREHCLTAPNGTMEFTLEFVSKVGLAELLVQMVARREKVFRSVRARGPDAARESWDDVVAVIDAASAVVERLEARADRLATTTPAR